MMTQAENFLHTTHRTITWFKKAFSNDELELAAPFQRNPVWTLLQKSYLLDTVLNGLPIPEIYMQDKVDEAGNENHVVVDGQQRIRAVLEYVTGEYALEGDDVAKQWRDRKFDQLSGDERKAVFNYKFVARVLPPDLQEEDIRKIFARINKNVVSLTEQELRNATYWGPFIKSIQYMADDDPFWAECGLFSANDHRRMNDHEFISELAIAHLHGPQNKKDKLDYYYQLYEGQFEDRTELEETFRRVTAEIARVLPRLKGTRWRKKSDFYTLFLEFSARAKKIPFDEAVVKTIGEKIQKFGEQVDSVLKLEERDWAEQDRTVVSYARNVARAASDRANRTARASAFSRFVFDEPSSFESADQMDNGKAEALAYTPAKESGAPA